MTPDATLLIFIALIWTKRALWVLRLRKKNPPLGPVHHTLQNPPKISVIVPARNEEKNIGNCLKYLAAQTYTNYEIIVVDDRSSDRTSEIVREFQKDKRTPIKLVQIQKLPDGWTGKNYALFTGSKAASGEWFLFTDADTTHKPFSLVTALQTARERGIDFLTLSPETESKSFWEKTVQPLAVGSLALWFPPKKVNDPDSELVLANGQFILIQKKAYEDIGGNESIKTEVVEDVALARKARSVGCLVQFLNGTPLYSTRMYTCLKEIITGWTRILTYLFEKNVLRIAHKIFLFSLFSIWPFVVLTQETALYLSRSIRFSQDMFFLSMLVAGLIVAVRFVGNLSVKTNPWFAFLHPVGSLVMVWILLKCVVRIIWNRPSVWKGQYYR